MSIPRPQTPLNTFLWYGPSYSGKSTQLALRISQLHKRTGLKGRVVGIDPGGTTNALLPLIEAGICEYWPLDLWTEISAFTLLDQATRGYWPVDVNTRNSPLQSCVREWKPCPFCGKDSGARFHAMVKECASCKKPYGAGVVLGTKSEPIHGLEAVGLVAFDSLTSAGNMLMDRLREINPEGGRFIPDFTDDEEAEYRKLTTEPQQKAFVNKLPNERKIAGLGKQHYGDAQTKVRQIVANVKQIPVEEVHFTALETGMTYTGEKLDIPVPVYGPSLPGKKLAEECIPWFSFVIHIASQTKKQANGQPLRNADGTAVIDYNLYLAPHSDAISPMQTWKAKNTAPVGGEMPLMVAGRDCRKFFDALDAAKERSKGFLLQ